MTGKVIPFSRDPHGFAAINPPRNPFHTALEVQRAIFYADEISGLLKASPGGMLLSQDQVDALLGPPPRLPTLPTACPADAPSPVSWGPSRLERWATRFLATVRS